MSLIVVETHYSAPLEPSERRQVLPKCWPCLVQLNVQWIRSILSVNRHRLITEFNAPDAETVRALYRRLGMPFDVIWAAESFTPESISDLNLQQGVDSLDL